VSRLTLAALALCLALAACGGGGSDEESDDQHRDIQPPACSRVPNPCT